MGRKFAVPYALYRVHGYVNPNLAGGTGGGSNGNGNGGGNGGGAMDGIDKGTGLSESDLDLLKEALDRTCSSSTPRPRGRRGR